jgi:AcrR family transcriptional regulator
MKPTNSISRRRESSELTRTRLIHAAEKIFARDGFEAAKLEEIATGAGYTRGAFYANFDSKEDLFLALLEREIKSRIDRADVYMQKFVEPEAKLRAFHDFYLTLSQDRRWSLLALEFKLFAVRHPEAKARLAAMNRRLVRSRIGILREIMEASGRKLPVRLTAIAMSLSAVTNALGLEHMLDRTMMPEEDLKKILSAYFNSLTGAQSPRS